MLTARTSAYFSFLAQIAHLAGGLLQTGSRAFRFRSALTILFLLQALGTRTVQAAEADATNEIVLGMSAVFTGVNADLGKNMQRGILAGLERANRGAGVNGHKLRLIALDDGYEPARTGLNMRQLIEKEHVLALIGNVGTPTAIVAVPLANEQKTLLFAPFAGGPILRNDPPDRYVINFRAGFAEELTAMIDALIDIGGLKPEEIAFLTQKENSVFAMGVAALQRHGLKDPSTILHTVYERNTLAVEGAVADLLTAEKPPRAVLVFATYGACAKFIKLCRDSDLNPIFLSLSFVGGNSLAEALDKTDARLIVTQVVPNPLDATIPIVRQYQADLKAMDPSSSADFGDLEGYIATRILTLALANIQGALTREAVVDALEELG
jgi:branched-chain amino acid transport system substrate-binding protein